MPHRDTLRLNLDPDIARRAAREARRANRLAHGGWVLLALFAVISGISYFVAPREVGSTALGTDPALPLVWNVLWLVGGLLVLPGVLVPHRMLELVGQVVLAIAVSMYSIAILIVAGPRPSFCMALAFALGAIARIVYLAYYAPDVSLSVERRQDDVNVRHDRRHTRGS